MSTKYFSRFLLVILGIGLFTLSACDEKEEMVETPVVGALLTNGPVPPISDVGAAEVHKMLTNLNFIKQYQDLLRDAFARSQGFIEEAKQRGAEKKGEEFDPSTIPNISDFDKFLAENVGFEGEFIVKPQADHYLVTFPAKTILDLGRSSKAAATGSVDQNLIEITHDLQLKVVPTGDPNAWKVALVIPERPMTFTSIKSGERSEFMTVALKAKDVKGLWHNSFQSFVQSSGTISDVSVLLSNMSGKAADKLEFKIGRITLNGTMTPDDKNLWSGPVNTTLENLVLKLPEDIGGTFQLFKAVIEAETEKLNPAAYAAFWPAYTDFNKSMMAYENTENAKLPADDIVKFLGVIKNFMKTGYVKSALNVKINGLEAFAPPTDPNLPPDAVTIDEIGFGGSGSGFDDDSGDIAFRYFHNNMNINLSQAPMDLPKEFIPINLNINLAAEKVPALSLIDKAGEIIKAGGAEKDKDTASALLTAKQDEILEIMTKAGTRVSSKETYIGNDIWLALLNGGINVKNTAMYKVAGESELRFYGLDVLMELLQNKAQNSENPQLQGLMQQAMFGLGMAQMFGQQGEDSQNRAYRGYKFTIGEDGNILLNGTNIMQMMGNAPQQAPGEAVQP